MTSMPAWASLGLVEEHVANAPRERLDGARRGRDPVPAEIADDLGARAGDRRLVLADAHDLDPARPGQQRHGGGDRAPRANA
jgi:hypothetical protein